MEVPAEIEAGLIRWFIILYNSSSEDIVRLYGDNAEQNEAILRKHTWGRRIKILPNSELKDHEFYDHTK